MFQRCGHTKNLLSTKINVQPSVDECVLMLSDVCCVLQDCDFDPLKYNSIIECEKPNNDLNRFRGYM